MTEPEIVAVLAVDHVSIIWVIYFLLAWSIGGMLGLAILWLYDRYL